MKLNVARAITGSTQKELAKKCGVSQTAISFVESGEVSLLHYGQKLSIEKLIGIKVNWDAEPEEDPLSRAEIRDMRFFYKTLTNNAPVEDVNSWLSGFDTSREAYTEAKRVIDTNVVAIPVLEMKWNSDGTPDFSHID